MFEKSSAFLRAPLSGDGHFIIDPFSWEIQQGNWAYAFELGSAHYTFIYNSSVSIGDTLRTKAYFARGNYNLTFQTTRFTTYGTFDVRLDGITVYSGDLYASSAQLNTMINKSFDVAVSGIKEIELVCTGKNASATNYYLVNHRLSFQRLS